jgi:acetyltransferase-like isoleucine patch superfamily enzyme
MLKKISYKLFLLYYENFFRPLFGRTLNYYLTSEPRLWGDDKRLVIAKSARVNCASFNTVSGNICIKDHVFFGTNVSVLTGSHDYTKFGLERVESGPKHGNDITIESGVWIGSNATIIGPCIVGRDAVVAAGSVVTRDVSPRSVVAGVPAKVIKML